MTAHFTMEEMLRSKVAERLHLDNLPPPYVRAKLHWTMAGLERCRAVLGCPMIVTSGYRNDELNKAVGGAENSQHMEGEAADFIAPRFGDPEAVVGALAPMVQILGIDQLILEGSWVHVTFTDNPRYQVLRIKNQGFEPWEPIDNVPG